MNISSLSPFPILSLSSHLSLLKKIGIPSFSAQQKKITLIILGIFCILAVSYITYSFLSSKAKTAARNATSPQDPKDSLKKLLDTVKKEMFSEMTTVLTNGHVDIADVESGKFFIDIHSPTSKEKKEYIVKKATPSCYRFLSKKIKEIFKEIEDSVKIEDIPTLDISWDVILKDKEGKFYHAYVTHACETSEWKIRGNSCIFNLDEFWSEVRGNKPAVLVNDQMEFV